MCMRQGVLMVVMVSERSWHMRVRMVHSVQSAIGEEGIRGRGRGLPMTRRT